MKYLIIADPHYHNYQRFAKIEDGKNSRLTHLIDATNEAVEIGLQNNVDAMLVAGDVFHTRGRIPVTVLNAVFEMFFNIATKLPVYIVSGNHDMVNLNGGETAIEVLGMIPNVHTFTEPSVVDFGDDKLGFIPYFHDTNEFVDHFKKMCKTPSERPNIIVAHIGVDNFRPTLNIPETLITTQFLKDVMVKGLFISGHYHNKKYMIVDDRFQTLSPGSIIQHTFGDEGDDRGCWIGNAKKVDFHPLTYPEFRTFTHVDQCYQMFSGFARIKNEYQNKIDRMMLALPAAKAFEVELVVKERKKIDEIIAITSPMQMIAEYIDKMPEYGKHKKALMKKLAEVVE